jgi:hypothetical protein
MDDRVACDLELITDHENIRGFQLPLNHVPVMQEVQSVQNRGQHLPRFALCQGTVQQQLCKVLVGVLHHRIEMRRSVQLASARRQNPNQAGMYQACRRHPAGELHLGESIRGGYELDRDFGRLPRRELGEVNAAVIRATQIATQRKLAVDDVSLPLRPELVHAPSVMSCRSRNLRRRSR